MLVLHEKDNKYSDLYEIINYIFL